MRIIKKAKGFTATELVVALGIMSVFVLLCCAIMTLSENLSYRTAQSASDKLSADSIFSVVEENLIFARSLLISPTEMSNADQFCFNVRGGKLYFDDMDIYGDSYYGGCTIELDAVIDDASAGLLTLEIRIINEDGEQQYSKRATITMLNIAKDPEKSIERNGETFSFENPYLYFRSNREPSLPVTTVETSTTTYATTTTAPTTTTLSNDSEFTITMRPLRYADTDPHYMIRFTNLGNNQWRVSSVDYNLPRLEIKIHNIGQYAQIVGYGFTGCYSENNCNVNITNNNNDFEATMNSDNSGFSFIIIASGNVPLQNNQNNIDAAYNFISQGEVTTVTTVTTSQQNGSEFTVTMRSLRHSDTDPRYQLKFTNQGNNTWRISSVENNLPQLSVKIQNIGNFAQQNGYSFTGCGSTWNCNVSMTNNNNNFEATMYTGNTGFAFEIYASGNVPLQNYQNSIDVVYEYLNQAEVTTTPTVTTTQTPQQGYPISIQVNQSTIMDNIASRYGGWIIGNGDSPTNCYTDYITAAQVNNCSTGLRLSYNVTNFVQNEYISFKLLLVRPGEESQTPTTLLYAREEQNNGYILSWFQFRVAQDYYKEALQSSGTLTLSKGMLQGLVPDGWVVRAIGICFSGTASNSGVNPQINITGLQLI